MIAINLLIFERYSKDEEVVVDEIVETTVELPPMPTASTAAGQRTFYVRTPGQFLPPSRT